MCKTNRNSILPVLSIIMSMLIVSPLSFHALIQGNNLQDSELDADNNWSYYVDSIEKSWLIYARSQNIDTYIEEKAGFHFLRNNINIHNIYLYSNYGLSIYMIKAKRPKNKNVSNAIPLGGHAPPYMDVL